MSLNELCWSELNRIKTHYKKEEEMGKRISFTCIECTSGENNLVYDNRMDETTCNSCGMVQPFNYFFFRGKNEYLPDTSNKISKSIYKQKDYLVRKLDEISCFRVVIEEELMEQIVLQCKNKEISFKLVKKILTNLGHKQKYLQIPTILNSLAPEKYPPVVLSCHERIKIVDMFSKYMDTFYLINNYQRKNLLNYHFVLKKLFEMNGLKVFSHYFNTPKGKKTIQIHEEIWNNICIYNNWLRN